MMMTSLDASAHSGNSQPFLLLNGKYVLLNDIHGAIIKELNMPSDIAPENYSIGEKIIFEIDTAKTLISSEVLEKTTFHWEFGDGKTSEGIKSAHTYDKKGTYVLQLSASYLDNKPTLFDTLLIHVIPSDNFKTPVAVISVNGKKIRDPKNELTVTKPGQPVNLVASLEPNNSNLKYLWDLGNGSSSSEEKVVQTYPPNYSFVSPILKIQDEDGFISYTYANIEFSENAKEANSNNTRNFIIVGGVIAAVITLLATFLLRRKSRLKND